MYVWRQIQGLWIGVKMTPSGVLGKFFKTTTFFQPKRFLTSYY